MMPSPAVSLEGSLLWTLEEIGRLISQSGNASETLTRAAARSSRVPSAQMSCGCGHSGRRPPQERVGSRYPARRRPVLRPGIFQAAARPGRLATRRLHRRRSPALPIRPALSHGTPISISIDTRTGSIVAHVWQVAVGRNTLLLLDSNVEGSRPEDRELTARLYGGDQRIGIRQELLLGVGGVRALDAMGIVLGVLHLNEGHSAFAALELVRHRMITEGTSVWDAIRRVAGQVVFTTHTAVPAGHDWFSPSLIDEHLGPLRETLELSPDEFMGLGRENPEENNEGFCMTVLALKLSERANAVSSLHGHVSRAMWNPLFRARGEERVPIGHITNGVYVQTWLAPQMRQVYGRHLGPDWPDRAGDPEFWDRIDAVDDGELCRR